MKYIAWEADRPDEDALLLSWGRVGYGFVPVDSPAVDEYLLRVREVYTHGDALLARFRITGDDETLRWFAARNRLDEYDFFRHFLGSEPVGQALPQLRLPQVVRHVPFGQSITGLLTLDGELAAVLVLGGGHKRFTGPAKEAKRLAAACVTELTGDRYEDFLIYICRAAWAPWFRGRYWDATWLLVDRRDAEVTLLCVTDED